MVAAADFGLGLLVSGTAFRPELPRSKTALAYALLSGAALGIDLALWHESIYSVGPGISTLLNSLQIFFPCRHRLFPV